MKQSGINIYAQEAKIEIQQMGDKRPTIIDNKDIRRRGSGFQILLVFDSINIQNLNVSI